VVLLPALPLAIEVELPLAVDLLGSLHRRKDRHVRPSSHRESERSGRPIHRPEIPYTEATGKQVTYEHDEP
jgi:hypothetical protein